MLLLMRGVLIVDGICMVAAVVGIVRAVLEYRRQIRADRAPEARTLTGKVTKRYVRPTYPIDDEDWG